MDFDKFKSSKERTVLAYVVLKEHTLGYLCRLGSRLYLGVLHGKILKGGRDWKLSDLMLSSQDFKHVRKATEEDFDDFKVLSKGYALT